MAQPEAKQMLRALSVEGPVYFKQKPKGVCLEMCCCQQENEFAIGRELGGWTFDGTDDFILTEHASFFCRCCFGPHRETRYVLSQGGKAGGAPIMEYERPLRCAVAPCKCCCFQNIYVHETGSAEEIGHVQERCFCCVPMLTVYGKAEQELYEIHQPTCCGGLVVNCCDKGGAGCCKVPFYIYPPSGGEDARVGSLVKVWGGLKKECCTLANNFEVEFPKDATQEHVALLYGASLLLDHNFFEGGRQNGG